MLMTRPWQSCTVRHQLLLSQSPAQSTAQACSPWLATPQEMVQMLYAARLPFCCRSSWDRMTTALLSLHPTWLIRSVTRVYAACHPLAIHRLLHLPYFIRWTRCCCLLVTWQTISSVPVCSTALSTEWTLLISSGVCSACLLHQGRHCEVWMKSVLIVLIATCIPV